MLPSNNNIISLWHHQLWSGQEDAMSLSRRHFLRMSATLVALAAPQSSWAQPYPNRPVRIIVGFAPGAGTDISARLIAQWLSKRLGQQFIVENKPGAGSNIAMDTVAKAQADGYTRKDSKCKTCSFYWAF
jgi:tripartite-type tricarboxylate transporter receptor subunit TctC